MFKNMFKKTYTMIDTHRKAKSEEEPNIPEGLWRKCNKCGQGEAIARNHNEKAALT